MAIYLNGLSAMLRVQAPGLTHQSKGLGCLAWQSSVRVSADQYAPQSRQSSPEMLPHQIKESSLHRRCGDYVCCFSMIVSRRRTLYTLPEQAERKPLRWLKLFRDGLSLFSSF